MAIAFCNRPAVLPNAIGSALNQTYNLIAPVEVIVVVSAGPPCMKKVGTCGGTMTADCKEFILPAALASEPRLRIVWEADYPKIAGVKPGGAYPMAIGSMVARGEYVTPPLHP